jgi:MFS transporter, DHA2 family, methylenomycin A resistance protein
VPPIVSLLPGAVAARQAGIASGLLNTFRQMGGSFGIAIYAAIVAAQASLLRSLRTSLTATAILLAVTATVRRTAAQWHHPQERCTPQPLGRTTRCRPSR